jgi:hypothetical protein
MELTFNDMPQVLAELFAEVRNIKAMIENKVEGNTSMTDEVIDRVELCKRLNINAGTALRWEKKGKIPTIRIGDCVRYNWPAVLTALESKSVK